MGGESYYQTTRGRGSFRGRGRGSFGGRGVQKRSQNKTNNYFRCGEANHWGTECPKKDNVCAWCGGTGHIEKRGYGKINGATRGGNIGESGRRGRGSGGAGGAGKGQGSHGNFGEGEEEQWHAEVMIGEVNMGVGDGDGEDKEWVCDSGADFHMIGVITLSIVSIGVNQDGLPPNF